MFTIDYNEKHAEAKNRDKLVKETCLQGEKSQNHQRQIRNRSRLF